MDRGEKFRALNKKLDCIGDFKDNWDGEDAYPVDPKTIQLTRDLLEILTYLPLDIFVTNLAELYLEYEHFEAPKSNEKIQSAKFRIILYDTCIDIYNKPQNAEVFEVSLIPFCVLGEGYLKILNSLITFMVESISGESDRFRDSLELQALNFLTVKRTTDRTELMQFQLDAVERKYDCIERGRPYNSYMDVRYSLIQEMISLLAKCEYEINILYGQEMGIIISCGMVVYMMFDNDITLFQLVNNLVEEKVDNLNAEKLAELFLEKIGKNL